MAKDPAAEQQHGPEQRKCCTTGLAGMTAAVPDPAVVFALRQFRLRRAESDVDEDDGNTPPVKEDTPVKG